MILSDGRSVICPINGMYISGLMASTAYEKLEKVVEGTKFINGIEKTRIAA